MFEKEKCFCRSLFCAYRHKIKFTTCFTIGTPYNKIKSSIVNKYGKSFAYLLYGRRAGCNRSHNAFHDVEKFTWEELFLEITLKNGQDHF